MKKPLLFIIIAFISFNGLAQWSSNSAQNLSLCGASGNQYSPIIISDGSDGSIIAWTDARNNNTTGTDVYIQKINGDGVLQWTTNGVTICNASNTQNEIQMISDDAGGAIIVWKDQRTSNNLNIYAQRINSNGVPQWTTNGVVICSATGIQQYPLLTTDGTGGAIICWADYRNGNNFAIYCQRVDANGNLLWQNNGAFIINLTSSQMFISIISDGVQGAIISCALSTTDNYDIYSQRIDSNGSVIWNAGGVIICNAQGAQTAVKSVSDGSNGAIIAWQDNRDSDRKSVYAQKVNGTGEIQWILNGAVICNSTSTDSREIEIIADEAGGAFILYSDSRNGNQDIYGQRISNNGIVQWSTDGESICIHSADQAEIYLSLDGNGGIIVTFDDNRISGYTEIYAQRITGNGQVLWATDGVPVSTAPLWQDFSVHIFNGTEAIVSWEDMRNSPVGGYAYDVFVQNICLDGTLGVCAPVGINEEENNSLIIYPNPATNTLTIEIASGKGIYQLQDITGKVLLSGLATGETKFSLDISTLSKGIYLLSLIDGEQQVNRKVVKE